MLQTALYMLSYIVHIKLVPRRPWNSPVLPNLHSLNIGEESGTFSCVKKFSTNVQRIPWESVATEQKNNIINQNNHVNYKRLNKKAIPA